MKYIYFYLLLLSILLSSCSFFGDGDETEPNSRAEAFIMNNDGSNYTFLYNGSEKAQIEPDNQSLIVFKNDGLYLCNSIGLLTKISNVILGFDDFLSPDCQKLLISYKNNMNYTNTIHLSDLQGNNIINITNDSAMVYFNQKFSYDSNWVIFGSKKGYEYKINLKNIITNTNYIITDSIPFGNICFNLIDKVYYSQNHAILCYDISSQTKNIIDENIFNNPQLIISSNGNALIYKKNENEIIYCNTETNEKKRIFTQHTDEYTKFKIDNNGMYAYVLNGGPLYKINLHNLQIHFLKPGHAYWDFSLSPDCTKIFVLENIQNGGAE